MIYEKNINTRSHNWLIHHISIQSVKKNAPQIKGRLLDIGCGKKPYKRILEPYCLEYIGVDYAATPHGISEVDVVADAVKMPFPEDSFDSVVSFQVMEHINEPALFLAEAYRILKKEGVMLLTTPFLWGEHEQPHDYFRFTRHGLAYLAEKAGFQVLSIEPDTGSVSTIILRLNYLLNRLPLGPFRFLLLPIFYIDQYLALKILKWDRAYFSEDTATFTVLLRKP